MTHDHGLMAALYPALSAHLGNTLPLFQHVPAGVVPPYVVMEVESVEAGNGLPSPHFCTRGRLMLRVWSAYEGRLEISKHLKMLEAFFQGKEVALNPGNVWFEAVKIAYGAPSGKTQQGWHQGHVTVAFVLRA